MGLFSFLKKKKPQVGKVPTDKSSFEKGIPPPEGFPEKKLGVGQPVQPTTTAEPKHVDDLGFPEQPESFELPPLEFPEIPEEEEPEKITLKEALGKPQPSMYEPEMKKVANPSEARPTPSEIPELDLSALKPKASEDLEEDIDVEEEKESFTAQDMEKKKEEPEVKPVPVERPMTIRKVEPIKAPEEPIVVKEAQGPLFINLLGYNNIISSIDDAKRNLRNAESKLLNANTIKSKEDSELETYYSSLENIQRKLMFIDKMLFEKIQG